MARPVLILLSWLSLFLTVYGANPRLHERRNSHDIDARDNKVPLRILPLGASLTWGLLSPSGNGYRKPLRDQLRFKGWEVNMVGSKSNATSTMNDKDVEAHSGDTIHKVTEAAKNSLAYKPNVVTINAGTNDCAYEVDLAHIGDRMRHLIKDVLLAAEGMDQTTIILSTLLPSSNPPTKKNSPAANRQYRSLVKSLRDEGVKIVLADMNPPKGKPGAGFIKHPQDYIPPGGTEADADSTHPNDFGYSKMAYIFYEAIAEAEKNNFITKAAPLEGTCKNEPLDTDSESDPNNTQKRSQVVTDETYHVSSENKGVAHTLKSKYDRNQWRFARLFSKDRDDLLSWASNEKGDASAVYGTWRNTEKENKLFHKIDDTNVINNCTPSGINFIDLNADGLDDFVCVIDDGTAYASINQGDGSHSKPPTFKSIGEIKHKEDGSSQDRVVLGDVDGDGRADYCVIADNGDVNCWKNKELEDNRQDWQNLGKTYDGKGKGDIRSLRLEDVNGDNRDDWIWVEDDARTTVYTNPGECEKNHDGVCQILSWQQNFAKDTVDPATRGLRDRIHFARIYAKKENPGLSNLQDFVFIEHEEKDDKTHHFKLHVWKNTSSGGKGEIKGQGKAEKLESTSTTDTFTQADQCLPDHKGDDGPIKDPHLPRPTNE